MSIPAFDLAGVLPPYLGSEPGVSNMQSPYQASSLELVYRFGTTDRRNRYLRGLLNLREELRSVGLESGIQWIDGSFVEDKERSGSEPGDIDIVTVFRRPNHLLSYPAWAAAITPYLPTLFDPGYCKSNFFCEAFYIDATADGINTARQSAFWFGLFSHQRATFRWKGIVALDLGPSDIDADADAELARRGW